MNLFEEKSLYSIFKEQLEVTFETKEAIFNNLESKTFYNGRKITLGDSILFAILRDKAQTQIIVLGEEDFPNFRASDDSSSFFPILHNRSESPLISFAVGGM